MCLLLVSERQRARGVPSREQRERAGREDAAGGGGREERHRARLLAPVTSAPKPVDERVQCVPQTHADVSCITMCITMYIYIPYRLRVYTSLMHHNASHNTITMYHTMYHYVYHITSI